MYYPLGIGCESKVVPVLTVIMLCLFIFSVHISVSQGLGPNTSDEYVSDYSVTHVVKRPVRKTACLVTARFRFPRQTDGLTQPSTSGSKFTMG